MYMPWHTQAPYAIDESESSLQEQHARLTNQEAEKPLHSLAWGRGVGELTLSLREELGRDGQDSALLLHFAIGILF